MTRVITVAALAALLTVHRAEAVTTKNIVYADFNQKNAPIAIWNERKSRNIEVCAGDWCQLVQWRPPVRTKDIYAWDAIFLMAYFFDLPDDYQLKRRSLAMSLLAKHGGKCEITLTRGAAACVLEQLQRQHGFKFWRVQYDIGARCVSQFIPQTPYFTKEGECRDMTKQKR